MNSCDEAIDLALDQAGIPLSLAVRKALSMHLSMVIEANATMNLTSVVDPQMAAWIHVVDSLLGLKAISKAPIGPLCDLGTGAGYPGVPLCVSSARKTTLVEATGKKAIFLREVVAALDLDAEVFGERAEEIAFAPGGRFAVVTARALSSLPSVLELAAPLLMLRGRVVAYKGAPEAEEIVRADKVAALVGLRKVDTERFILSGAGRAPRTLLIYERIVDSSISLPRRVGFAQHAPLA